VIFRARDFDHAELRDMAVYKLCVEQREPLPPQPRHKIYQRNLAGVGRG
jgi:hypothetical protein